jgi:hypothetical protein
MMEFLGALVVVGTFVCWCDLTSAWTNVLRPIRALVPLYSKLPAAAGRGWRRICRHDLGSQNVVNVSLRHVRTRDGPRPHDP